MNGREFLHFADTQDYYYKERRREVRRIAKKFLIYMLLLLLFSWLVFVGTAELMFKYNVTEYLEQTSRANTVEMAKDRLGKALAYIEHNHYTSGYTSVFYKSPTDDVGFWYDNLHQSYVELSSIGNESTMLEKSNVLIKLRETIMNKSEVVLPFAICVFPYNSAVTYSIILIHLTLLIVGAVWLYNDIKN